MTVFDAPEYDDHRAVHFIKDPVSGLKAIIAIHDNSLGPALGGLRMFDYANDADALTDVLRLSRGMTFKNALAGIPYGGGKAVIIGDPKTHKSASLLRGFGRYVESLGGTYITAEDVGTTVADMDVLRKETAYARGTTSGAGDPSPYTARGVLQAIRRTTAEVTGSSNVESTHVVIQGLGNVGMTLAHMLSDRGARLTVTDIDAKRCETAREQYGAEVVAPANIFSITADIFAPCAMGAVINDATLPQLRVKAVCGAANNQLAEPKHSRDLARRSILYIPDFVANAGGVIEIGMEGLVTPAQITARVDGIYDTLDNILNRARGRQLPVDVAEALALERIATARRTADAA